MRRQRGVALILALATAALATLLATRLLSRADAGLSAAQAARDREQALRLVQGGIDWARAALEEDARHNVVDHRGEAWATAIPPTAAEGGELAGRIDDLDGRFDINGLATRNDLEAFRRLLALLALPPELADAVMPLLPAAHVDALAGAAGMTPAFLDRLRPHIAALPMRTPLNANTASAEVLAARAGLAIGQARAVARDRDAIAFRDAADIGSRSGSAWLKRNAGVGSRYFLVAASVRLNGVQLAATAMIERRVGETPRIVWQRIS